MSGEIYNPKLSKHILKSCIGCAQMQKLITAQGYSKNVHKEADQCSMFFSEKGVVRCQLGYAVSPEVSEVYPLERCPKPKTRNQLEICKMQQKFGNLEKTTFKSSFQED